MKKILLTLSLLIVFILAGIYFYPSNKENTIYLNAHNEATYQKLSSLKKSLKANGRSAYLSRHGESESGKYNLYTASDIKNLPKVLDTNAINILWIDTLEANENIEALHSFDVIVVKNMPAFYFLKAINARAAYIPDAVEMQKVKHPATLTKAMYYGEDGNNFSLTTYLIKNNHISLDVYGKNYEQHIPQRFIISPTPQNSDFRNYALVLTDQSDEEIRNEQINSQIIRIIENGGLPYVRYNPGIEKMFGDIIPMYHNEQEFAEWYKNLMQSPFEQTQRRNRLLQKSKKWNSNSQANKFIELFDIMQKKRIIR